MSLRLVCAGTDVRPQNILCLCSIDTDIVFLPTVGVYKFQPAEEIMQFDRRQSVRF
jgi:hypothetical protein